MMNPGVRRELADTAARYAKRNGYTPTVVTEENKAQALQDLAKGRPVSLRVRFIGDYVPKGFTPTDTLLFVDTSGFGERGEPALTAEQFLQAMRPGYAYAIVEAGQFQAYVQEYRITDPKTLRGE